MSKTKRLAAGLAALMMLAAPGVRAADTGEATAEMRRLDLARRYLMASHQVDNFAISYAETVRNSTMTSCADKACRDDLAESVRRASLDEAPAYFEEVAHVWASVFTEKELSDALAFTLSPSGQAMIAKAPQISKLGGPISARVQERIWTRAGGYFCKRQPQQCESYQGSNRSQS